jgi:hypothetical protein
MNRPPETRPSAVHAATSIAAAAVLVPFVSLLDSIRRAAEAAGTLDESGAS